MRAIWVVVAVLGLLGMGVIAATSSGACATGAANCAISSITTDPTRWVLLIVLGIVVAVAIYRIIQLAPRK